GIELVDVFPRVRPRDDFAGAHREILEHHVFTRCERYLLAGTPDPLGRGVDLKIFDLDPWVPGAVWPSCKRSHARQQSFERKGLDEIVVGTDVEALDAVRHRVAGSDDEDGRASATGAHALQYRQAVETGQHQIEDYHVIIVFDGVPESFLAVAGHVDGEARLP